MSSSSPISTLARPDGAEVPPASIIVEHDEVRVGPDFSLTLQRTLRVPSDGERYPLPPGLGRLPIRWLKGAGWCVPLHRREALWLAFDGVDERPTAVQVGAGRVNAVSGGEWTEGLTGHPQNYVVVPDQLWLDGINAGDGFVRQFLGVPLGEGLTVDSHVGAGREVGALQLRVFAADPARVPPKPPARNTTVMAGAMGVGAGGQVLQRIHPDPNGTDAWDRATATEVVLRLVAAEDWSALAGEPPPPTPIDAAAYTAHGLPWFELYDEDQGDLPAAAGLAVVDPVDDLPGDRSPKVGPEHVQPLHKSRRAPL